MDIAIKLSLKRDIERVNGTLKKLVSPKSSLTHSVYSQVIDGGKRLRPLLVLYSAKASGFDRDSDSLVVGSAIELVHTASLLHDDIIDEAEFRRGKPSANSVFGIKPAVLGGDYLFSLAYNVVLSYDKEIAKRISEAAYTLTEGEMLEIERAFNLDVGEDDYFDVIYKKTAVLIEASCACGSILADFKFMDSLIEYGRNLGLAFQIRDDCLDYEGEKEEVGKDLGIDLKEGKLTLPVLRAMQKKSGLRSMIGEFFEKRDEAILQEIMNLVKEYGLKEAINEAKVFSKKAKSALAALPDSKYKDYLVAIADYSIERKR